MTLREAMRWDRPPIPGRGRGIALTARHIAGGKSSLVATAHPTVASRSRPGPWSQGPVRSPSSAASSPTSWASIRRASPYRARYEQRAARSRQRGQQRDRYSGTCRARRRAEAARGAGRASHRSGARRRETPQLGKPGDPAWLNYCGYGVELSVDAETGAVHIYDVAMVVDVGAIINPIGHRGQLEGAFSMGLGHALTEELYLEGGRITNPTLAEYKLPCQRDMPPLRIVELSADGGPGPSGEGRRRVQRRRCRSGDRKRDRRACGVRLDAMSFTAERIYKALHDGRSRTPA